MDPSRARAVGFVVAKRHASQRRRENPAQGSIPKTDNICSKVVDFKVYITDIISNKWWIG